MAGIYSLDDLRNAANAAGIDGSDEDIIKEYANRAGMNPVEIANRLGYKGGGSTMTRERVSSSIDSYQANMYGVGEAVLQKTPAADWFRRRRQSNEFESEVASSRAKAMGAIDSYKDVDWTSPSQIGNYAAGLGIQSAPYLAEALAGGGAGSVALRGGALGLSRSAAGRLGAVGASYPSAVGDILQNQRQAGDGETNLGAAALGGIPYAALNAVGLEGALAAGRPLARIGAFGDDVAGFRGGALRFGKNAAIQGGIEGSTEVGQEMINQGFGRMVTNPNETMFSPDAMGRYAESFVGGGLLGGMGSGATGGWRRSDAWYQSQLQQPKNLLNPQPAAPQLEFGQQGELFEGAPAAAPTAPQAPEEIVAKHAEYERVLDALQARYETASAQYQATGDQATWERERATLMSQLDQLAPAYEELSQQVDRLGSMGGDVVPSGQMGLPFSSGRLDAPLSMAELERVSQSPQYSPGLIDQSIGVRPPPTQDQRDARAADMAAALSADSGTRVSQPDGQLERPADMQELMTRNLPGETAPTSAAPDQAVENATRARATAPEFFKGQRAGGRRKTANAIIGDGNPDGVAKRMADKYNEYASDETKREHADAVAAWYTAFTGKDIKSTPTQGAPNVSVPTGPGQRPAGDGAGGSVDAQGSVGVPGPNAAPAVGSAPATAGVPGRDAANEPVPPAAQGSAPAVAAPRVIAKNGDGNYPINLGKIPGGWRATLETLDGVTELQVKSVNDVDTSARIAEAPTKEEAVAKLNAQLAAWADSTKAEAVAKRMSGSIADTVIRPSGDLDMGLLRKALGDDERMLLAARLHLGVKEDGSATTGEALTQKEAANVAGLGANSGARVSKALKAIGLDPTWIKSFQARRGAEESVSIMDPDLAEGAGVISSAGGSQGAIESPKTGLISSQPWYAKAMDEKASPGTVVEAMVRSVGYVVQPGSGVPARVAGANRTAQEALAARVQSVMKGMSLKEQNALLEAAEAKLGRVKETTNETDETDGAGTPADDEGAAPSGAEDSGSDQELPDVQTKQAGTEETGRPRQVKNVVEGSGGTVLERGDTTLVNRAWAEAQKPFAGAIARLKELNLGHMLDWIGEWRWANSTDDAVAPAWLEGNGTRYVLTLKQAADIRSEVEAAWTLRHELAHAADLAVSGGVYSTHPDMEFTTDGETITPKGAVASELEELHATDDFWHDVLNYPLNSEKFGVTSPEETSGELFAQLFAVYTHPKGKLRLEADAPLAFRFIEEAVNDIQQNRPLKARTPGEVVARQKAFAHRYRGVSTGQQAFATSGGVGWNRPSSFRNTRNSAAAAVEGLPDAPPTAKTNRRLSGSYIDSLPLALRPVARKLHAILSRNMQAGLNKIVFTEDLLNRAKELGVKAADTYKQLANRRASFTGEHERRVIDAVNLYNEVPEEERGKGPDSVNAFIKDSTLREAWAFQPDWLSDPVTIDPEAKAAYDKLSPQSRTFARAVFRVGHDTLAQKKQLVRAVTATEYDGLIEAAQKAGDTAEVESLTADKEKAMKQFGSLLKLQENKPYAPLKRFGKWVVIGESAEYRAAKAAGDQKKVRELEGNEDHYYVDFVESQLEAERVKERLDASGRYKHDTGDPGVTYRAREELRDGLYGGSNTLAALNKLRARADLVEDSGERKVLLNALTDMYLLQLGEDSARKNEMRRRGVAGDIDMVRSFEAQGLADARFLGQIKFGHPMLDAINEMRRSAHTGAQTERVAKQDVFNEVIARHIQAGEYEPSPWSQKLVKATSLWFLATSPSYYIQNATQPWMMSLPMMAAKHGYSESGSALLKAYQDIWGALKNSKATGQFNFDDLLGDKSPLKAEEKAAIEQLLNAGRIDIGMIAELGANRAEEGGTASRTWAKVDNSLRGVQLKLEAINRITSGLAAFRLEAAKGGDAFAYADDILQQTHGDYTAWNAPRAFNNNFGKVALQFRKFQLIQLTLLAKMLRNSFAGASKEERAVARKALAYTLGQAFLVGGGKALPIPFVAAALFSNAFGDDADEPPEFVLRKLIGDKDVADLLIDGLPAKLFGFSGQAIGGLGNTLAVAPFADFDITNRKAATEYAFTLLSGPFGGLYLRAADGIGYMANGDFIRGAEGLLPKGVTNILRAFRVGTEGNRQKDGDITISPEEVTFWDTLQQAAGFTPQRQYERMYRQDAAYKIEQSMTKESSRIKAKYSNAVRDGDADARTEAMDAWREYQAKREELGFKRQPLSDLLKAAQDKGKRETKTIGGVQYRNSDERFVRELSER